MTKLSLANLNAATKQLASNIVPPSSKQDWESFVDSERFLQAPLAEVIATCEQAIAQVFGTTEQQPLFARHIITELSAHHHATNHLLTHPDQLVNHPNLADQKAHLEEMLSAHGEIPSIGKTEPQAWLERNEAVLGDKVLLMRFITLSKLMIAFGTKIVRDHFSTTQGI